MATRKRKSSTRKRRTTARKTVRKRASHRVKGHVRKTKHGRVHVKGHSRKAPKRRR